MIRIFLRGIGKETLRLINIAYGRHLLLTNTIVAGTLMAFGDYIAQSRSIQTEEMEIRDWSRTKKMSITAAVGAPMRHYFYQRLQLVYPERDLRTIVKKVVLDELFFSPWCIVFFFVVIGCLEGQSWENIREEIILKFYFLYKTDLKLWTPLQVLNFKYVPIRFQILVMNFISVIYNTVVSVTKYSESMR